MRSLVLPCSIVLALGSVAACSSPRHNPGRDGGPGTNDTGVLGRDGGVIPTSCGGPGVSSICRGSSSIACNADGTEGAVTDCSSMGGGCIPNLGCSNPCTQAEQNNSYIGCEYWPVATLNNVLVARDSTTGAPIGRESFHFAVAVANPGSAAATVTVDRAGAQIASVSVAPGGLEVIQLPWDEQLQNPGNDTGIVPSVLARNAAYHLVSSLPVTVYQFNPLEYETTGSLPDTLGMTVNSFSNDASLLLPTHALTGNYLAIARATHQLERTAHPAGRPNMILQDVISVSPGFMTLVAVDDNTEVDITFTAHVTASTDGAVQAFAPGQTGHFSMNRADVLQITSDAPSACAPLPQHDTVPNGIYEIEVYYCAVGDDYDLTGSLVRTTSGRVSMVSGHNCAFVPANRWACDHLEEGMFPLETWGMSAFVTVTQPLRGEPNLIRILSGDDGNQLTFDPPGVQAPMTLNRGQYAEFEASQSFRVTGTGSINVAQFLVGQDYAGIGSSPAGASGDPSESLAIPTEQYRSSYTFLAPSTYQQNFVEISAPTGSTVMLDGNAVSGFTAVGSTGFGVATAQVNGGVHSISSSERFGIVVYGFGSYTSYMYPGGLDLQRINVPF
ncbi:MAG: IgGFc-binding protein [Sandaracinus sp.]